MLGNVAAKTITTGALFLACGLSWPIFLGYINGSETATVVPVMKWVESGAMSFDWALRVDTLTAVMLVVITSVSALVHLYSLGLYGRRSGPAALLRLSLAVHLRHADAGDREQSGADVLRLGRRGPRQLSADRLLVQEAERKRRRDQGLRGQPRGRSWLHARYFRHLPGVPDHQHSRNPRRCTRDAGGQHHRLHGHARGYDDGAVRAAVHRRDGQELRSSACTPGCPTRWKGRPRFPR